MNKEVNDIVKALRAFGQEAALASLGDSITWRAADEIEHLRSVIRDISEGKFSTYKARNGRDVGIEADDGEMCFIVHSDLIHAAEVAAGIA